MNGAAVTAKGRLAAAAALTVKAGGTRPACPQAAGMPRMGAGVGGAKDNSESENTPRASSDGLPVSVSAAVAAGSVAGAVGGAERWRGPAADDAAAWGPRNAAGNGAPEPRGHPKALTTADGRHDGWRGPAAPAIAAERRLFPDESDGAALV